MKQILNLYTSWRNNVLFAIGATATVLLCADPESLALFYATKLAILPLVAIAYRLFQHWDEQGHMDSLRNLCREED